MKEHRPARGIRTTAYDSRGRRLSDRNAEFYDDSNRKYIRLDDGPD